MKKGQIIERMLSPGLIAVVRAGSAAQVPLIAEALIAGGVIAIEITTSTPDYLVAIRETSRQIGDRGLVGVGTILSARDGSEAIVAGAQFVVSPIACFPLVPVCLAAGKPLMLGAYTATEAQAVHESGADFVKLFPADTLGPGYVRSLRAPLPHLRIVPTGGVDLQTAPEFLQAGCVALGVGSSLLKADLLKANDWEGLTRLAKKFVECIQPQENRKRPIYLQGENRWWR